MQKTVCRHFSIYTMHQDYTSTGAITRLSYPTIHTFIWYQLIQISPLSLTTSLQCCSLRVCQCQTVSLSTTNCLITTYLDCRVYLISYVLHTYISPVSLSPIIIILKIGSKGSYSQRPSQSHQPCQRHATSAYYIILDWRSKIMLQVVSSREANPITYYHCQIASLQMEIIMADELSNYAVSPF